MNRRAKIVATIGPASSSLPMLRKLAAAGVDVARLNFSHGNHQEHAKRIERIRRVSHEAGRAIAIMQDLQGPKIRTGPVKDDEPVRLKSGQQLLLTTEPAEGTSEQISIDFADMPSAVSPGDTILLDDGRLELRVVETGSTVVRAEVVHGGTLGAHKGVNVPGGRVTLPALTEKDLADLEFGIQQGVDIVAISFVRQASDIETLRRAIAKHTTGIRPPAIIAKLERPEALGCLDDVLSAADGVMVARGDLGVELSPARIPSVQKHIIRTANARLRPVITATQMLVSMIRSPRPTRAEASDVANAVFDGSDALMLSEETAAGDYPLEAVEMMHNIIIDAESHSAEWGVEPIVADLPVEDDAIATTHAACSLAHDRGVEAIAVFTRAGRSARLMSKARPRVPILAFTPEPKTYAQMALLWGVIPNLVPMAHTVEEMIDHVEQAGIGSGLLKPGDQVVMIASLPLGAMGPPNFTLLQTVGHPRGTAAPLGEPPT